MIAVKGKRGVQKEMKIKNAFFLFACFVLAGTDVVARSRRVSAGWGSKGVSDVEVKSLRKMPANGIGLQANYILPAKDVALFFKYYGGYSAKTRPQGRTIVFGGS
jgi:hypothetical protein